jgi:hypothetical protein
MRTTRPTRTATISPHRSPQNASSRIRVRCSPAASASRNPSSRVRKRFSTFGDSGSLIPVAGLWGSRGVGIRGRLLSDRLACSDGRRRVWGVSVAPERPSLADVVGG